MGGYQGQLIVYLEGGNMQSEGEVEKKHCHIHGVYKRWLF
jgi:hypothetical protein